LVSWKDKENRQNFSTSLRFHRIHHCTKYLELIPILLKLSLKIKEQGTHLNLFYEPSITLIAKSDNHTCTHAHTHTHTHTNYSPEYLMKTDIKIFYKILQNAFNITLEGSYTIINWDSFQGCKNILNFINQCGIPY